jgi:hypothetical protein
MTGPISRCRTRGTSDRSSASSMSVWCRYDSPYSPLLALSETSKIHKLFGGNVKKIRTRASSPRPLTLLILPHATPHRTTRPTGCA